MIYIISWSISVKYCLYCASFLKLDITRKTQLTEYLSFILKTYSVYTDRGVFYIFFHQGQIPFLGIYDYSRRETNFSVCLLAQHESFFLHQGQKITVSNFIIGYLEGGICPSWFNSSGAYAPHAPQVDTLLYKGNCSWEWFYYLSWISI